MKTVTIKFGSVDNATSFVKAIEDFESHFDLIYGQYVVDAKSLLGVMTMDIRQQSWFKNHGKRKWDANDYGGNLPLYRSIIFSSNLMVKLDLPIWILIDYAIMKMLGGSIF